MDICFKKLYKIRTRSIVLDHRLMLLINVDKCANIVSDTLNLRDPVIRLSNQVEIFIDVFELRIVDYELSDSQREKRNHDYIHYYT